MPCHYDLVIRNGVCVLPWGMEQTDIGVRDGRIAALDITADATAAQVIDARHLHVLPGLIDPHVHLREPGDAAVETIATGTRAAVLGGIAAVFDMPNTSPAITDADQLAWKQERAERVAWCDMGLYIGGTKENIPHLAELETTRGVCAIKIFAASSTGDLLVEDDASLERVMLGGRRRIAYHSEDEYRLQERRALFRRGEPYARHRRVARHRDRVPRHKAADRAFRKDQKASAYPARIDCRGTCITCATTATSPRSRCWSITSRRSPPRWTSELGGYGVMNPPIRDRRHWEAAWASVRDGTVDTLGSDHAPHARAKKQLPWPDCAAGLTGVQTIVPVMLDHVNAGRLSLPRLVDLPAPAPRASMACWAGRRPPAMMRISPWWTCRRDGGSRRAGLSSPCGWTPFAGLRT